MILTRTYKIIVALIAWSLVSAASAAPNSPTIKSQVARSAYNTSVRFLQKNPERRISYLPAGYSIPEKDDEVLVLFKQSNGEQSITRLNTFKAALIDLGRSITATSDRRNLVRAYRIVYKNLPRKFRKGLANPRLVQSQSLKTVRQSYNRLTRRIRLKFDLIITERRPAIPGLLTQNPIGNCSAEIGYEYAGVESELPDRCEVADYNPIGLFKNVDFPLKNDLTCIKNQGWRGTCAAHAIAATTETFTLVGGGSAENLSEQHIYYRGETEGDSQISSTDMQLYGLVTSTTLDAFDAGNFGLYYERTWNYNRSVGLGVPTLLPGLGVINHSNSCDASYVGELCSDYSWQTGASVPVLGFPIPDAPPTLPSTPVRQILSHAFLPADGAGGILTLSTLQTAIVLLSADVPVIVNMQVTDAFRNTTNGYVVQSGNDPVVGGHAMQLVGFVPTADLPALAPPPSEEGYFIVKNSWGTGAGDCGFYYLDFGYLRDHLTYLSVITVR